MDVKMIHCMLEKITECAKCELEEKGIENINAEEFGKVTDMIKDLAEAMYYRTIVVAMDGSEYGEEYDWEGRKGYSGQPRDSRGRYMSRRGRRMGYEEMMMPDYEMDEMEHMRDMDRGMNRMYYAGEGSGFQGMARSPGNDMGSGANRIHSGVGSYGQPGGRDSREGRSGQARRGYMETKELNKGNTPEEKQKKMKDLEAYTKELAEDVTEMISDASPEEKTLLKAKMQTLLQKIQ